MGQSVRVSVAALDPVLEAGAMSALLGCPEVAVVPEPQAADVLVVMADEMCGEVLDLVRVQRQRHERPEVVLVASDFTQVQALHALAVGARGLVRRREADASRLTRAVLAASSGDCTVPPDMLSLLLDQRAAGTAALDPWPGSGLSEREQAVLALIADGHETDEIARKLCYSARTVVGVVHDITHRFRLRNRAHAVAYAIRAGLL
jgi:DNA-binding NarL/FixJ family response regulator